jgi:MFS family permease
LIASRLLPYVPPRALMAPGLLVAAAGMALLAGLHTDSRYLPHILPAEIVVGLGMGCVMVPAFSVGTQGVERSEIGVASATVNTAQQVGGSVGTALLNTIATSVTAASMASPAQGPAGRLVALVHGYAAATRWAVVVFIVAAALAALMIDLGAARRRPG